MKQPSRRTVRSAFRRGAGCFLAAAGCAAAWAAEPALEAGLPATVAGTVPAVETTGERMPQLDGPGPRTQLEVVQWSRRQGPALGLALGASIQPSFAGGPQDVMRPTLGVRWRSPLGDSQRLDVAAWRHFGRRDDGVGGSTGRAEADVTTRIELQFSSPMTRRLRPELGALGMQLSADSKLSMKLRRGRPVLYYRARF